MIISLPEKQLLLEDEYQNTENKFHWPPEKENIYEFLEKILSKNPSGTRTISLL